MPKELLEIKQFQVGTITTPSSTDIPLEAASDSLNIDPISENGKLEGLPDDMILDTDKTFKDSSISEESFKFTKAAVINDSGTDRVVAYNPTDNKLYKVDGFVDGASANTARPTAISATALVSGSDEVTFEKNNKEIHIGTGNASTDIPKWCGVIPHGQFGASPTAGLQIQNAELDSPSLFPDIYSIVINASGTYIYGIEWEGNYVYKFDVANKKYARKSSKVFNSTQGLALASDGKLWVVEKDSSSNMYVIKLDTEELLDVVSVQITGGSTSISDILEIGDYLWFSKYGAAGGSSTTAGLWNKAVSGFIAGASSQAIDNKTPWAGAASGTPTQGDWHDGAGTPDEYIVDFTVPKVALIDVKENSNNFCGWFTKVDVGGSSANFKHDGSNTVAVSSCIQMVNYNSSAGDRLSTSEESGKLYRLNNATDYGTISSVTQGANLVLSHYSGATSEILFWSSVDYDSIDSGDTSSAHGTSGTSVDLSTAVSLSVDDSGIKYHVFAGAGNGRWAYGAAASLEKNLETSLDITFGVADGDFLANLNHKFFYKVSFLYDGYQESPLSDDFTTLLPAGSNKVIVLTVSIKNLALINKRITHLNIYRASSAVTTDTNPTGFYRLVGSYELNQSWAEITDSGDNPTWGNYRQKSITDNGDSGTSYEALNGISETLGNTLPNYALSTQLNNIHFIAKCSHPDLDDANTFMFKSQPYNFDQFDWSLDLLRLPTIPTVIKAFQGRIYAFDENNTYKIEPNNFYIEDTFEGVGCHGADAIITTEYGMFFADKNNIYMHNGQTAVPIATPILRKVEGSSLGWHANTYGSSTKVIYDSFRNSVLFSFKGSGSTSYFWAYNISLGRWDLIKVNASYSPDGYFTGRDGSIYLSINSRLYYFLGSTSKRTWNWTSKQITAGQDTQIKKFKKFRITGSPSGTLGNSSAGIQCTVDGSGVTETGSTSEWTVDSKDGKKCQIFLNGQTGDVDSIGIIYRRKPVK